MEAAEKRTSKDPSPSEKPLTEAPETAAVMTPPLGVMQSMVESALRNILMQATPSQGPVLPGLSALLGLGVPAGSSAEPLEDSQSLAGDPTSAGSKSSSKKRASSSTKAKSAKKSKPLSDHVPMDVDGTGEPPASSSSGVASRRADRASVDPRPPVGLTAAGDRGSCHGRRSGDPSFEPAVRRFEGEEFPRFGGIPSDRGLDREESLDGVLDLTRSSIVHQGVSGVVPRAHSSPGFHDVRRQTGAIVNQAAPLPPTVRTPGLTARTAIEPLARGRSGRVGDDRDPSSSDDDQSDQTEGSNFRWALESITRRMGREVEEPGPSKGTGRFASAPVRKVIRLPIAAKLTSTMEKINTAVTAKRDVARSESIFPKSRVRPASIDTYRSCEGSHQTAVPVEDPHLHLLSRKQGVWSAYLKKARLSQWQTLSHQLMGQLSLSDHLTTLVQEFVDEADMSEEGRTNVLGALGVLAGVLQAAQRDSAHLGAQLDLTARDADLRTLDVTPGDEAELRSRPLFSGLTYANLSMGDVSVFREHLRDEALTRALTKTPAGQGGKKAKGQKSTQPSAPQAPPPPSQSFRGAQPPPPQGEAGKRGGKGGGRFKGGKKGTKK